MSNIKNLRQRNPAQIDEPPLEEEEDSGGVSSRLAAHMAEVIVRGVDPLGGL